MTERRHIGVPDRSGEKETIMADEQNAHNDGAQTFELADDSLIEVAGGVEIPQNMPTAARKRAKCLSCGTYFYFGSAHDTLASTRCPSCGSTSSHVFA